MGNLKELDEGQENFLLLYQLSFLESDQEIEELVQTLGLERPLFLCVFEPLHLQVDSLIQYSVYLFHERPSVFSFVSVICCLGAFQVLNQLSIVHAVFAQT